VGTETVSFDSLSGSNQQPLKAKAFKGFAVAHPTGNRRELLAKPNKISILFAQKRRGRVAQYIGDGVEQNTDARMTDSLSGSKLT
jgi:hypothetical protein